MEPSDPPPTPSPPDHDAEYPDVTVVLLLHYPGEHEVQTAALIRAQRYPGRIVVLAIESSPDPSRPANRALREAADVWEAIAPETFGHGSTRNLALDLCTTPIVAFLSQDAHPSDNNWLHALVRPLAEKRAEASYGRQRSPDPDPEREATFSYLYPDDSELKTKARAAELGLRTYHFSDVSSAFISDIARAVRFPEDLPVFEDIGIAKRLIDAGHRVAYVPEAVVLHAHDLGWRPMIARYRQIGAIYERLGIFADLRRAAGRPLLGEGVRVSRAIAPQPRHGAGRIARGVAVAGVKAGAVAWGRIEERHRARGTSRHRPRRAAGLP